MLETAAPSEGVLYSAPSEDVLVAPSESVLGSAPSEDGWESAPSEGVREVLVLLVVLLLDPVGWQFAQ